MKIINKIITLDFLKGKKAYLGSAVLFVLGGLLALNIITREQFESLSAMALAFTAVGLRKAM